MGGPPSGGERRVWSGRDLAHGGPDPGRPIQPWHADDVRPYDANPPWEPLGSVKAAHIAAGLVRLRVAHPPGQGPGVASSMFKLYGTELNKRKLELCVSIAGTQALGWEGEGFSREELGLTREWLRSRANSIEGGTSEIQLNIIAKNVLGLPD